MKTIFRIILIILIMITCIVTIVKTCKKDASTDWIGILGWFVASLITIFYVSEL